MKCPLRMITRPGLMAKDVHPYDSCLEEECAWWEDIEEGCILTFIEKDLAGIWTLLTTISNQIYAIRKGGKAE
jgi:hypothetical protein